MKASIGKSEIKGAIAAPSSKSYTIRGVMCAALSEGESELVNPLGSDDTVAAGDVLSKCGISMRQTERLWSIRGGKFTAPGSDLYCHESAATLRFMTAISSVIPGECRLTMAPGLAQRPLQPLLGALGKLGVEYSYRPEENELTVSSGSLAGGTTDLPGNISSQFISALLLVSPLSKNGVSIHLTSPLESRAFLQMTMETMKAFGVMVSATDNWRDYRISPQKYKARRYRIEADWSSASYLLALGALCGEVEVLNLNSGSLQGDRVVLDLMKQMGAAVTTDSSSVSVRKSRLKAIKADLNECIDMLPTMAILAAAAEGTSVFSGISRARLKESDRIAAVREGLAAIGVRSVDDNDTLTITGGTGRGGQVNTRGDHRIAMAFAVLGAGTGNISLDNADCVSKTYPGFWDDLKTLGGKVEIYE